MECIWLHNPLDTKNVSKFVSKQKLHACGSYYKQNVTPYLGLVPSQKAEILLCQKLCQTDFKRRFYRIYALKTLDLSTKSRVFTYLFIRRTNERRINSPSLVLCRFYGVIWTYMPLPLEPMTYSYLDMCSNFVGKSKTFSLCFCRFFPVFVRF